MKNSRRLVLSVISIVVLLLIVLSVVHIATKDQSVSAENGNSIFVGKNKFSFEYPSALRFHVPYGGSDQEADSQEASFTAPSGHRAQIDFSVIRNDKYSSLCDSAEQLRAIPQYSNQFETQVVNGLTYTKQTQKAQSQTGLGYSTAYTLKRNNLCYWFSMSSFKEGNATAEFPEFKADFSTLDEIVKTLKLL